MNDKDQLQLNVIYTNDPNSHAIYVREQEYGETTPESETYIIGSYAFTSCVLAAFYHPTHSAMIHLNVFTQIAALPLLWEKYTKKLEDNSSITITLIARSEGYSGEFIQNLSSFFEQKKCKVNKQLLYQASYAAYAINSRNGNIIGSNEPILSTTEKINEKLANFPIPASTDGDAIIEVISNGQLIENITMENIIYRRTANDFNITNYKPTFLTNPNAIPKAALSDNLHDRLNFITKSFNT